MRSSILLFFSLFICILSRAETVEPIKKFKSFDGMELAYSMELPDLKTNPNDTLSVIIFIHGSGPQSMDADVSDITKNKEKNLLFKSYSGAFANKGFATFRYNKRAFELVSKYIGELKKGARPQPILDHEQHPLEDYVKDGVEAVKFVRTKLPKAKIYLFGHSEGTQVSLNILNRESEVAGVILLGFYNEGISTALLEQSIYRNIGLFRTLDKNKDSVLDKNEYSKKNELGSAIRSQLKSLDLNGDKKVSLDEFNAGNYSRIILENNPAMRGYLKDQANLPKPTDIIAKTDRKVMFIHGEWDNQTPIYQVKAVELVNNEVWKKKNIKFLYFSKTGHALDKRDSYEDVMYKVPDAENLSKMVEESSIFLTSVRD